MDMQRRTKRQRQSTVSTIKCLRQGNINNVTQKTDIEMEEEKSNEEEDRQF